METFFILGLLLALLAVAAPAIYVMRKRMGARCGELELARLMKRRGVTIEDAAKNPHAFAAAVRRCAFCRSVEECGKWLASDAREGVEEFCPNAHYLKRLEQR